MSSVVGASPEAEAEAEVLPQPLLSTNDRSMGFVGVAELLAGFGNGWGDIRKPEEVVIVAAKNKYNAAVPVPATILAQVMLGALSTATRKNQNVRRLKDTGLSS